MTQRPHHRLHGVGAISYNSRSHLVFLQGKINTARYIAQAINPRATVIYSRGRWWTFSAGRHTSTYGCYDATCSSWRTTALTSKNSRFLANWTQMGHDEAGTYSFCRACQNHCRIATMGARCLGQSIAGYLTPSWPSACKNTCLCCHQRGLHCVLIGLFGYPLLWHVCFIWSEFVII